MYNTNGTMEQLDDGQVYLKARLRSFFRSVLIKAAPPR